MIILKLCLGLAERKTSLGAIGRISPGFNAISNQNYVQKPSNSQHLNYLHLDKTEPLGLQNIRLQPAARHQCRGTGGGGEGTEAFHILRVWYTWLDKVCNFIIFLLTPHLGHCVAGRASVALFSLKRDLVPLNFLISFSEKTPFVQIHNLYKCTSYPYTQFVQKGLK